MAQDTLTNLQSRINEGKSENKPGKNTKTRVFQLMLDILDTVKGWLSKLNFDIDANGKRITNLPAAVGATEPVRKQEFDNKFLYQPRQIHTIFSGTTTLTKNGTISITLSGVIGINYGYGKYATIAAGTYNLGGSGTLYIKVLKDMSYANVVPTLTTNAVDLTPDCIILAWVNYDKISTIWDIYLDNKIYQQAQISPTFSTTAKIVKTVNTSITLSGIIGFYHGNGKYVTIKANTYNFTDTGLLYVKALRDISYFDLIPTYTNNATDITADCILLAWYSSGQILTIWDAYLISPYQPRQIHTIFSGTTTLTKNGTTSITLSGVIGINYGYGKYATIAAGSYNFGGSGTLYIKVLIDMSYANVVPTLTTNAVDLTPDCIILAWVNYDKISTIWDIYLTQSASIYTSIDLTVDTPVITNTIAFKDDEEIPFYKDSLFKRIYSGKKYTVVLETELSAGIRRIEIGNPTYLKASQIGSNTRIVFESEFTNRKLVYKNLTKVIKSLSTGKTGTTKTLMTIGDSLTQGQLGAASMPLALIKTRLAAYGININGVGTYAMEGNSATPPGLAGTYMGEGRGYWNYKTFVGKDSSPYAQPVTINTASIYTTKFENPFLRLATATDKANHPDWCFTNKVANPADIDGISYSTNATYTNYYIFDFVNYLTAHSVATPDIITLALSINDWQEDGVMNVSDEYLSFMIMYEQIRSALPTTPILIVPSAPLFPEDQPEWENEMFPLLERMITYIEGKQATDANLKTIPIFQHLSRFFAFKTLGASANISTYNNIQSATANDVHFLDKATSRKEYMDIYEAVILSVI